MLEYDRIDVSQEIDAKKTNFSHEYSTCHYWYFLEIQCEINFRFQPEVCDGCHDLMQKAKSFNVVIVSIKGTYYKIHFWYMSKNKAINLLNNANLNEKSGTL